jgi:hypothetical protein
MSVYLRHTSDRELQLEGKVVVQSSFFPPALKDIIRKVMWLIIDVCERSVYFTCLQGLRKKELTWDYLFSDNFMHIATYAWVPLQYVLEMVEDRVLPAETKVLVWGRCGRRTHRAMVFAQPSLQGLTELAVEHFWRVRAMPGQLDYDPQIAGMLQRYGVTLPFTDSRTSPTNRYVYCKLHNGQCSASIRLLRGRVPPVHAPHDQVQRLPALQLLGLPGAALQGGQRARGVGK